MILASIITRGDMALPGKPNARIIALGVLAGLFHLFSVVHQTRQMGTFASPTVAWLVMIASTVTLFTL